MRSSENFRRKLTSTLWFLPMLIAFCGVLLGLAMVSLDIAIGQRLGYFPRFFGIEPAGATNVLAIIAGSTITVAGTVYSITIVALTLASTQFSPRILRNFMRDTGNQFVLGIMVGIFAYCIVVLRTIRAGGEDAISFVPTVSVMLGVLLGLLGVGLLIYFIHHVAMAIQATTIISTIADETIFEIEGNFPANDQDFPVDSEARRILEAGHGIFINSPESGYIQNADAHALMDLAAKYDLILLMRRRIGEFIVKDLPLIEAFPKNSAFVLDKNIKWQLTATYSIGSFRTVEGDVAFGLRQIVDIALKALSPAVNDTTTGITCIDYLTAILATLGSRPSCPTELNKDGRLRLVMEQQSYEDFFDLSFNQIRQNAMGNVAIIVRQLGSINVLSKINLSLDSRAERAERHDLMQNQAALLFELAQKTIPAKSDLEKINNYYAGVEKSLNERENIIKKL